MEPATVAPHVHYADGNLSKITDSCVVCFLLSAFVRRGAQRRLVYQNSRLQGPPRTIFTKFIARTVPYDFMGLALDDIRLATFRSENCDHFDENAMPSVWNNTLPDHESLTDVYVYMSEFKVATIQCNNLKSMYDAHTRASTHRVRAAAGS